MIFHSYQKMKQFLKYRDHDHDHDYNIFYVNFFYYLFFDLFFYFRNCVGRGNRRIYLIFLILSAIFLSNFSILSLMSHSHGVCMESAGPKSPGFFASVRFCPLEYFQFLFYSVSFLFFPFFLIVFLF